MINVPRVSCIVIFLNGERFLDQAIRSVVDQTLPDWELLLVDDGSTDSSSAIARRWAASDARIRYLEHPDHENRGMSASRNLGLRHATGEFVQFLDGDDVLLPTKFATQVALLDAHPEVQATYGPTLQWHSWTGNFADLVKDSRNGLGLPAGTITEPGELLAHYRRTRSHTVPAICSILARRDAVLGFGGFEDSFRGSFEDQVFYARMGLHLRVLITDEVLDRYRQHEDSCCAKNVSDLSWHPELLNPTEHRYLLWLEGYLREVGHAEGEIWDSVQRALHPYRRPWSRTAVRDRAVRAAYRGKRSIRSVVPPAAWELAKRMLGRPAPQPTAVLPLPELVVPSLEPPIVELAASAS